MKTQRLTAQFILDTRAMKEEECIKFLPHGTWPPYMDSVWRNVLQKTIFDKEIEYLTDNDSMLHSFLESNSRQYMGLVREHKAKYKAPIIRQDGNSGIGKGGI